MSNKRKKTKTKIKKADEFRTSLKKNKKHCSSLESSLPLRRWVNFTIFKTPVSQAPEKKPWATDKLLKKITFCQVKKKSLCTLILRRWNTLTTYEIKNCKEEKLQPLICRRGHAVRCRAVRIWAHTFKGLHQTGIYFQHSHTIVAITGYKVHFVLSALAPICHSQPSLYPYIARPKSVRRSKIVPNRKTNCREMKKKPFP